MKKLLAILMAICILFTLTACGGGETVSAPEPPPPPSETEQTQATQTAVDYAVVLQISINPQCLMMIDKNNKVVNIEPRNDDAVALLEDIEPTSENYILKVAELVSVSIQKGFLKKDGKVEFSVVEIKDNSVKADDILKKASKSAKENAQKAGLKISTNIEDKKEDKDTESKKDTTSKKESSSKPTSSKTESKKPTSSKTSSKQNTTSSKPSQSTEKEDKEETKVLNPKKDLPYEREYAGNYRIEQGNLVGSGISFHTEGGIDGPYCLLLSPQFEPKRTDPDQTVFTHNGKKYYSVGAGMTPYNMELTETEIIVKNSFYEETETINLRLSLKSDDTFVITYSQMSEYPKGTVLTFLR